MGKEPEKAAVTAAAVRPQGVRRRRLQRQGGQRWSGRAAMCVKQLFVCVSWLMALGVMPLNIWAADGNEIPCTYVGHLLTDTNWYGFLANITIMTTGRMTFEFSYPADKCCQNILFYTEDQLSEISNRMNCWQKEYLLLPENDQILRLTPRFTWSGCHITYPNGVPHYDCVGGRSFASKKASQRPTTWYLAVSNCAGISGLDLQYIMRIYGHMGDCKPGYRILSTTPAATQETPKVEEVKGGTTPNQEADKACIIEGNLNTSVNWYGFLTNITINEGGGFRFYMDYPYDMQKQNVILYNDEDIVKLEADQSCWEKEGIIRSRKEPEQILDLSFRSSWNGCHTRNFSHGRNLTCQGERRYNDPRKIYIAVSNCWSNHGLVLHYRLEVTGYQKGTCSGASSAMYYHRSYRTRSGLYFDHWITFLTSHFTLWISFAVIIYMQLGYLSPHLHISGACGTGAGLLCHHLDKQQSQQWPASSASSTSSVAAAATTTRDLHTQRPRNPGHTLYDIR